MSDDEVPPLDIKTRINSQKTDKGVKVDQKLLSEAFQWRLSQNDCQNRGYVLDGYPICYETSEQVFYVVPTLESLKKPKETNAEGEEEEAPAEEMNDDEMADREELMKPKFQSLIYPDSVILIRGDDKYIRDHAKTLSKESNTKWDPENLNRRLAKWN
jgi:adenylate kinase